MDLFEQMWELNPYTIDNEGKFRLQMMLDLNGFIYSSMCREWLQGESRDPSHTITHITFGNTLWLGGPFLNHPENPRTILTYRELMKKLEENLIVR